MRFEGNIEEQAKLMHNKAKKRELVLQTEEEEGEEDEKMESGETENAKSSKEEQSET